MQINFIQQYLKNQVLFFLILMQQSSHPESDCSLVFTTDKEGRSGHFEWAGSNKCPNDALFVHVLFFSIHVSADAALT